MAFRVHWRKKVSIKRVVSKLAFSVIGLYVGGTVLNQLGATMNQTESPFYKGLTLIGWTVGGYPACPGGENYSTTCAYPSSGQACNDLAQSTQPGNNCITKYTGGGGLLTVIGIVCLASIVLEFVAVRW